MASSKWCQELEMWGGFLPLWGGFLPPSGAFLPFAAGFSFVLSFFTFFGQMFVFFGGRILPSCNGFSPFQSKISPSLQYPPPQAQPRPIAVRVYILHPPLCHIQPSSAGWGQDLGLGLGFGVRAGSSGWVLGLWLGFGVMI